MITGNEFAYAQTRMQTRLGLRLSDSGWDSLRANVEFRSFLEQARATPLRPWLSSIAPSTDVHDMERILRGHLHERIEEVAQWLPAKWRAAVRWSAQLANLPAVERLLAGAEPSPWMLEDAELAPLASTDPRARHALFASSAGVAATDVESSLREHWLATWRTRLPRIGPTHSRRLQRLVALAVEHVDTFADDPARNAHAAWQARLGFEHRLVGHFRRAFMEPAAVFAFLLLVALEFERLRGALVARTLFEIETR